MAKFWDNLQYYEDTVEKHKITKEEIEFLKELQHEMNTQDHVGQADPRYWTIRDYYRIYGESLNNPDGYVVYDDCEEVCECKYDVFGRKGMQGVIKYFTETYEDDFTAEDFEYIDNSEDLKDMIEEKGYDLISISEYETCVKYSGFFLTQKAAEKHLRENQHHYSDYATTYAMTAWRSEEADMLYQILKSVDFDNLEVEHGR